MAYQGGKLANGILLIAADRLPGNRQAVLDSG